jgi:hypothetical protein
MIRKLFITVLPSMLVGGLVFGSAVGSADDGRTLVGFWPAASDVGVTNAAKKTGATDKTGAPTPPVPPKPPRPPRAGGGFSVSVHDGKVQIGGVDHLIDSQIDQALQSIASDPNIPPAIRDKLVKRVEKVRAKVKQRVATIDADDLGDLGEELGEELGKMGEEIGEEMEELGKEMERLGRHFDKKMGKDFAEQMARKWGNFDVHIDRGDWDDDDDDDDDDLDVDDDDLDDVVRDLGDLKLQAPQRDAIKKLRIDSDAKVAAAKRELARAEEHLQRQLANTSASDAEISRAIDSVTQQEAAIRKARILAWVNARRVLDDSQRKKVESAKGKTR